MQSVRIIEMPNCKMVSSGTGMFGQNKFDRFHGWFSSLPKSMYPKNFLYWDGAGFCWLYLYDDSFKAPDEFEIVDFTGGLYAVATDVDQHTDVDAMKAEVDEFLDKNGLERDTSRFELGNVITSQAANEIMGYNQMDYYVPVRRKL